MERFSAGKHKAPQEIRTFFVTASTWGRRSIFRSDRLAQLYLRTLDEYRRAGKFLLHEFVLMPDHFHLLVGLKPDSALSELVGKIKSGSAGFINKQRWVAGRFEWQSGFGAFSYSHSQLGTVIRYIQNQEKHHARQTFQDEYRSLLERFQVPHDERYVFKAPE